MNIKYVLAVVVIKAVFCDNKLQRKTRSTRSAPRLNTITADFEEQHSPENYFPDVEYPTNILDVAKPYYFKAADKVVLDPFPKEVKDSFKFISSGGKINKGASPVIKTATLENIPQQKVLLNNNDLPSANKNQTNDWVTVSETEYTSAELNTTEELHSEEERNFIPVSTNTKSSKEEGDILPVATNTKSSEEEEDIIPVATNTKSSKEEGDIVPVATNTEINVEQIVVDHTSSEENLNVTEAKGN